MTDLWRDNFHKAYLTLGGLGERVLGFCDLRLSHSEYINKYLFEQVRIFKMLILKSEIFSDNFKSFRKILLFRTKCFRTMLNDFGHIEMFLDNVKCFWTY
jgi:hypothetical protein